MYRFMISLNGSLLSMNTYLLGAIAWTIPIQIRFVCKIICFLIVFCRFIPAMAAGEKIGAIAMTKPAIGSNLQGIRTRAVADGNDYIINGSKVFITNGILSDDFVVVAITDPNAKSNAHGITLLAFEERMPGKF